MPLPVAIAFTVVLAVEMLWLIASMTASLHLGSTGPLWLCWPARFWDAVHSRSAALRPPRPDYTRIARLERELGIGG
ncbi:hypothetical protein [Streptomyces rimosus]|uniref:hypothetical protein n=1 Tax=Streptomyces rimosus TaxID=1927 RepID=UPI0004CC5417|nr:hypothetical protein [Streptomyces rimosus]